MNRAFRRVLPLVVAAWALSACAAGSQLHVPGDLTRPPGAVAPSAGAPQAVIVDFAYAAPADGAIGRDYDRVRPIVWKGEPGKAMPDLIAGVLKEKGVATIRRGADGPGADAVPVTITGTVRRFEVNCRRAGMMNILTEATVSVTVAANGPGLPAPSEQTVTSSTSLPDVFVTPDDVHAALMSAANAVAEEAARKLIDGGIVQAAPPSPEAGSGK